MNVEQYEQFTNRLMESVSRYSEAIGLVAVGSMAAQDYLPDEWSDHDFFVIVQSGHQEFFRTNLSWLPHSSDIVFNYRETAHGVKVLYQSGHLLEFAVFDLQELSLARINRFRILLDRDDLQSHLKRIQAATVQESRPADIRWLLGQMISNLLVGVGRHRRGEWLSGHVFVKSNALRHLAMMCHLCLDSPRKKLLDNLDPVRRFEFVFPDQGAEINRALLLSTPEAAARLLSFAETYLQPHIPNWPGEAVATVKNFIG